MNKTIYMAPMEGLTDYTFRNAYETVFGKGRVAKYFMPFISPNQSEKFLAKEIRDIDPANNATLKAIPQVMANDPRDFIWTCKMLFEEYGYDEINLNAGCPSGTVFSKFKGSGMLREIYRLEKFLDGVFEDQFIRDNIKVSVKTRIGVESPSEFSDILETYNNYPLEELIVHPRVRTDYYRNHVNLEAFREAVANSKNKLVFNGDIFTRKNYLSLIKDFPEIDAYMLGRGLIADPALINVISAADSEQYVRDMDADKADMKKLHDLVLEARTAIMPGDTHAIHRMKEMWCYMEYVFTDCKKEIKAVKKSQRLVDYRIAVDVFFKKARLLEQDNIIFSKKF